MLCCSVIRTPAGRCVKLHRLRPTTPQHATQGRPNSHDSSTRQLLPRNRAYCLEQYLISSAWPLQRSTACVIRELPVLSSISARELGDATEVRCTRTLLDTDGFGCGDSVRIQELQRVQVVQLGFGSEIRAARAIPVVVDSAQVAV